MWKRKMVAYLPLDVIELLALRPKPTTAAGQAEDEETQAKWLEKTVKAKNNIILTLGQ